MSANEAFMPSYHDNDIVCGDKQVWGEGEYRSILDNEPRIGFKRSVLGGLVRCFYKANIILGDILGEGGNGTVLSCHFTDPHNLDDVFPTTYAIKLSRHAHEEWDSFEGECENLEALSRLAPDCIVPYVGRVYDGRHIEQEEQEPDQGRRVGPPPIAGIVLQYMPHGDFGSVLSLLARKYAFSARGAPHPEVARFYVVDLLMKLYGIHQAGYYHGDVKLENMMMTADGRILLADFGTAGVDCRDNWSEGVGAALPLMAPELFTYIFDDLPVEKYVGLRRPSDLWSAGIILYLLMFGRTPYTGRSDAEIYRSLNNFIFEQRWTEIDPADLLAREKWEALQFTKKLLVWHPEGRPSWDDIMNDPYVHDQWVMMERGCCKAPLVQQHDGTWMPSLEWEGLL
ncbi:hypothetical protein M422DRAFT_262924 [Sphaerobolus stellatus SS14]|uniref:Protein kinase domain-containing protein n=1 Tax=Sphaerobolus stellatus (strain SS14) TaxID=990650 RepID=A0A0C9UJC5_SPHS4|nr:hypothetical protein M422DRAFT_262924 [Sphaerobolus stellatus SS14]